MNGNILNSAVRLTPRNLFPFRFAAHLAWMKSFGSGYTVTTAIVYAPERNTLIIFPSFAREIDESWDIDITVQSMFDGEGRAYSLSGAAFFLRLKRSF